MKKEYKSLIVDIVIGALTGYFLLHPLSMLFYNDTDRLSLNNEEKMLHYFESPMAYYFILIGIALALIYGISRLNLKKKNNLLEKQKKELHNLNATKDKFFSIISHDLRSPFNGFLGLTEIMAEESSNLTMDEIQKLAFNMRNSATNLFNLLENLLEWSKKQQGLISFNPKVLELLPIVDDGIAMMLETIKNKGIEIAHDIPDDLTVFTDCNMLQSVIRNLVSNAVKFTLKGGKISISAKATDNKSVEVSIRDSGIGMSSKMIEDLFRIDVETNRKGTEGELSSGLGLLLCKEFIEETGGNIWVESEEGNGTTVYFTIPCNA